jgi:hypothetical protein
VLARYLGYAERDQGLRGGNLTVASATTTELCGSGAESAALTISGTTSISSFGSSCPAGRLKFLRFSNILTLTHNGTSLLPGHDDDYAISL